MAEFLELQDQVPQAKATVDVYLSALQDAREFYKERAAIERQASERLSALAKKAQQQYASKATALVVGESPSRAWSGGQDNNTFGRAWSTVINEADAEAKDRGALADALDAEIVTPLKVVIAKRTELVKKHFTFYGTLVAERDRLYEARDAAKGRYDSTCADVESHRAKQEHATADHRAEKAGHRFDKASVEMALAKNDYLRAIAVANAAKAHFFAEDLPALTKTWQSIWTVLLQRFTSILLRAGELIVYQRKAAMMLSEREEKSVRGIDAATDQKVYALHNMRNFFEPKDAKFEPSSVWHDTSDVDLSHDASMVYMQNSLAALQKKLNEPSTLESKRKEAAGLEQLLTAYAANPALGDADEVQEGMLEAQRAVILLELERHANQADVAWMKESLGGDLGGGRPHQLKPSAFPVPVACVVCGSNIWGIGKPGSVCTSCKSACHKHCELRLPANCGMPQQAPSHKRTSSVSTRASSNSASPSTSSFSTAPTTASSVTRTTSRASTTASVARSTSRREPPARPPPRGVSSLIVLVLYAYTATSPDELTIEVGEQVSLVQADDGTGWAKAKKASGQIGLVPASYLETGSQGNGEAATLSIVHDFTGQADEELNVSAGEKVTLHGRGRSYGAGWVEVQDARGKTGVVPEWSVD